MTPAVAAAEAPTLAPERLTAIYTAFIAALSLTPAHVTELKTKRGYLDETIAALKFRSGGSRPDVEQALAATQATPAELVASGLACIGSGGGTYPNPQLTDEPRILIPYLAQDGQTVVKVRPHKLGFAGQGVALYCPFTAFAHPRDPLVLTEGEFKAAALWQLGFSAIGMPGVSSFAGKHAEQLQALVASLEPKRIVVCFDREVKDDPSLPNFKPDFRKRHDTDFWAWVVGWLLKDRPVGIARLPAEWMRDGKADCDSALALGRTRVDFEKVFKHAVDPVKFANALTGDASVVVGRKIRRYLQRFGSPNLVEERSRVSGHRYLWIERDSNGQETGRVPLSDFLLELDHLVVGDLQAERIVRIVDNVGERSGPLVLRPSDMASMNGFKAWALAQGEYSWSGGTKQLDLLWTHLNAAGDGSIIRRTALTGEVEPGLWLFRNGVIHQGHYVAPDPETGIAWAGRRGYQLEPDADQPSLLPKAPETCTTVTARHRELLELLRLNLGGKPVAWLGIGWGLATLFSRQLFNVHGCFPILYCLGEKGSGKTTFARWLMRGLFGIDTHGRPMLSTEKSQFRLLAKRCSLPAWYDEFRETRDMGRHIAAFCSVYNRQGYGRAQKTGDLKTDDVPVRGTLLLSGVVPPKDDQLQSRCVLLGFSEKTRDPKTFLAVNDRIGELNEILCLALLRYDALAKEIINGTRAAIETFQQETGNARMALNYAMCMAAFHAVLGDAIPTAPLLEYARTSMHLVGERLESEHPLAEFWTTVAALAANNRLGRAHLDHDGAQIYVWMPGVFYEVEQAHRLRRGDLPFREADALEWLKEQPYYVPPPRQTPENDRAARSTVMRKMDGVGRRVVIITREHAPEALREAAEHVRRNDIVSNHAIPDGHP